MSYCRWSTDNFSCDLYCYEHVDGGYAIHIAGNRIVSKLPPDADWRLAETNWDEFCRQRDVWMEAMEVAEREDITLPYAGESFYPETLEQFRDKLINLRQIGYNFPDYVLRIVDEEISDREADCE